jgi:hypothetical protein
MAAKPGTTDDDGVNYNGNGAPSGPHYNLNLIGMDNPKGKVEDQTIQSKGKRIFVNLWDNTKILLQEGDFEVIDYDGTDGIAIFQLPATEASCKNGPPTCDGVTDYSVYARALGSGSATLTTCAAPAGTDPGNLTGPGDTDYCSTLNWLAVGGNGGKFENVSRELLYIYGDFGDGLKKYPLFGDPTYMYYWDYENEGLRLAQLRFYEIPTDTGSYDLNDQGYVVGCECLFPDD